MSHPVEESLWNWLWTCGKYRQHDNFYDDDDDDDIRKTEDIL
jgi:hypothetical protein